MLRKNGFSAIAASILAVAVLLVFGVPTARAAHDGGLPSCYSCHNLSSDVNLGFEPNTSYINKNSRTLEAMKTANGGAVPAQFGCTYCHNDETRTGATPMHGVLTHFSSKTSMHPVGYNFVLNANTSGEYLSTWGSAVQNTLDCVDCHDMSLGSTGIYPEHGAPPVGNPYLLRNVAAADEYDNLCRSCHGNAAGLVKGVDGIANDVRVTAHQDGVATGSGGTGPISESDGTLLRTTVAGGNGQCTACHDTHYSNRERLFNDGHEGDPAINVATDCTSVCHYPGDVNNNYLTHGHGKPTSATGTTLGFGCTSCHTVNSRHDSPYTDTRAAKMFASTPDASVSTFGKSQKSICGTCHGAYEPHAGNTHPVGCIDCHDEHAEGSGAASNIFMVPQQLPNNRAAGTELVFFEHLTGADNDYYTPTGGVHPPDAGVCDNSICHAGKTSGDGTPAAPLSILMTSSHHTGGNQGEGTDCSSCHLHGDTSVGSWGATGSCTSCHAQPPTSAAGADAGYIDQTPFFNEARTPHARHVTPAPLGYGYPCQSCHAMYNDSQTHFTTPSTYQSIWFDQADNPATTPFNAGNPTDTPNYDKGTVTCSSLYCHSDGATPAAVGSQQWMTSMNLPDYFTLNLNCDACHGDGDGNGLGRSYPLDAALNHDRHVGKGTGCQNCHYQTTANGTSITLANGLHVNHAKDVSSGGLFNTFAVSFGWDGATKTCSAVSCHTGEQFVAAPIQWTDATSSCTHCHNNGTNDGALVNAWPVQGEHLLHAGAQSAISYGYACANCHPDNSVTHAPLDKVTSVIFTGNFVPGGTFDNDGPNNTTVVYPAIDPDDNTCSNTYCHGTDPVWMPDWDSGIYRDSAANTRAPSCDACHGTAGLTTGRPNSPTVGGRHTGTTHATLGCTVCHVNDDTDKALHAQGPARLAGTPPPPDRSDAGMAALIDGATYTRAATASTDQGFSYTAGTCGDMTLGCHPAAQWGDSYGCATCHGNRVTGSSWPTGGRPTYYYDDDAGAHPEHLAALQAKEGFTLSQADQVEMCAYCHPSPGSATHRTNTVGSPATQVDVVNDGNAANVGTFGRIDPLPDGVETLDVNAAVAYDIATKVCSNADCHYENPTPTYGPAPGTLGWDGGDTNASTCATCHADGVAAYTATDLPNAHDVHVDEAPAGRDLACTQCHPDNLADTRHLNGSVDFSFAATLGEPGGTPGSQAGSDGLVKYGVLAGTFATCDNLYCHGADAPFPTATMGGTVTSPTWNLPATGDCGTCHLDTTAAWNPGGSNRHQVHVGTVSTYNLGCEICHYSVTTDGTTITTQTSHVNLEANVAFSATDPRLNTTLAPVSTYGGDTVVGSGYGTCDNTYCHSQGTDLVAPFTQAPNSGAMTWDSALTSCENCHGGPLNAGPFYLDPTLVDGTPKANKHQLHTRNIFSSGIACNTCHPAVGTPAFQTIHVNGSYDPAAGANNTLDDFTFTRGAVAGGVNGTCDNVVCHGGNTVSWAEDMTAAPWNANANHFTCDVCHGETGGVPTNTDVNDFSIDIMAAGAVMSKVSAAEYAAFGHGASAPRTIQKACNDCHDSTVNHETGAANLSGAGPLSPNPFRLRDQDTGVAGVQSCSANASCHVAGTVGPATGKTLGSIVTHSNEAMAPDSTRTWPAWNPRCTECHDPHGDDTNLSMIQREIYDKGSTVQSLNTGSEDWGVPTLPNDNSAVVFTNNSTGIAAGSYAEASPNFSGVCQECHERSTATGGVASFHDGPAGGTAVAGNHPAAPGDCSTCHTHDKAFKAQGCYSCHGNTTTRAYWPDGATYPDIAGAHLNHVNTVGTWLFNENGNVAGAGLLGLTANGGSDAKQKAVCAWCHPNPGLARAGKAGETNHDDNGVQVSPADVLGDGVVAGQFQLYYNGTLAPLPRGSVTDPDATYSSATHSCSNVNCHNQVATPSGANNWNVPPVWTTTSCGTIQCHSTPAASGAHATHTAVAQKNYACTQCHVGPASLQHGNGQVNLAWTAGLESDGDGFYDHDLSGAASAGDNNFTPAFDGAAANFACFNIYCHGDFTGGTAANQPRWGTPADGDCGTCHGATAVTLTNGSHPTHFDAAYGPDLGAACGTCHTGNALSAASHVDGTKSFETRKIAVANPAPTNLAGTEVCNACHGNSSGTRGAWIATVKTAWPTPTLNDYSAGVTCESCHGRYDAANSSADNTGLPATNVMGNNSTYGSEVTGHTLPAGQYPVSNNTAAAKACVTCHAPGHPHTWGVDTPGYNGLRIVGSLNTVDLGAATQVEQVCNACHQTVGTENGDQVSSHGNQNPSFTASINHDPNAQDFAYRCDACHDVHGLTLNAASNPNIFMVKPQIEVQNYSAPGGGTSPGATIPVRFTAKSGPDSADDGLGAGVCTTCHNNADRPGAGTGLANFGGQHAGLDGYSNNEQGSDCSGCHTHTWDSLTLSQDGFMPQQCNACHTYPGLANLGGVTHLLSGVHDIHAGAPGIAGPANYAFPCQTCHFGFDHNQTGLLVGQVWSVPNANVNIQFDPARNGGTPAYAGVPAFGSPAPGVGGTGICSGLYCHGDGAPFPTATMSGTDTTPVWNQVATGDCGTCHLDTVPSWNGRGSNRHASHVGTTNGYNMGCDLCHYGVTPDGATVPAASMSLHVNGLANVTFSAADPRLNTTLPPVSAYGGDTVVGSGYGTCDNTYCHSQGTDLVPPFQQPPTSATMTWDSGSSSCSNCHGPSSFGPVYGDGLLVVDGIPKANKHGVHRNILTTGSSCTSCHGWFSTAFRTYHVNGSYDPTGGSNNTLDDYSFTPGAVGGGINGSCSAVVCHGGNTVSWAENMSAAPWNANGNHFTCDICHAEVGGNPTATDVNDFSIDIAAPGAVMSKVSATEYAAAGTGGHGSTSPKTIQKACNACHDSTVNHESIAADLSGANPFRLSATGQTCSTALGCHVAGTTGPATGQDISLFVTHSDEAMLNPGLYTAKRTWPAWNPRCTECHDPHGDANLSMIQRELYDKGSTVLGADTTNEDWGVPRTTNDNNALVFTDNATGQNNLGTSYANTVSPWSSLCQECHEAANHVSYRDNATADSTGHPASPNDCSGCHKHDTAFKPSGCNGCHGSAVTGGYWPDGAAYPDIAGAHLNHVNAIGSWVYGESGDVAGAGLLGDNTAAHPALSSDEKQKAICAWCHPNPGEARAGKAGEAGHDDNGVWASPADVHGDGVPATASYQRYYNGTLAPLPRGSVTDTDATFTAATHSCSNVNCHNEVATPSGANNWNVPPAWTTTSCATIQCHGASTVPGSHLAHTAPAQMNYACAECHTTAPAILQHGNGQVNLGFGGLESTKGAGDGYYDKDAGGTNSAGDNGFSPAYDSGSAAATCMLIYCHGADNAWGGTDTTPVWNDFTTATCWNGSCHPAYGSAYQQTTGTPRHQITTGSHAVHSQKYTAGGAPITDVGPQLNPHAPCYACHNAMHSGSSCALCHDDELPGGAGVASKPTLTHVNGSVDFRDADYLNFYNNAAQTLAATPACDQCHSTADVGGSVGRDLAKSSWGTAGTIPCLNCHNVTDPAINKPFGAPFEAEVQAPAKDANWATAGHGNTTTYPWGAGRNGAAAACADCHDTASAHLNGALGQDRLTTAGNTLCNGCHDGAGLGLAVTQVSTHANTSGTMGNAPVNYAAQRAQFELNCVECHDVHGTANIFMVNTDDPDGPLVAPRTYNDGADTTSYLFQTTTGVVFNGNALGTDYAVSTANADKICQTCHTTTGGAGTPVYQHNNTTTGHATSTCTACHRHDVDADFAANSQDGFMPNADCAECHDAASPFDPGNGDPVAPGVNMVWWAASGHGKASGPVVACTDCHDIGLPSSPATTHLDGTYNSVWENGTVAGRNTNTAHLNTAYFDPVTSNGTGAWDVQVTFDNNCYNQCHVGKLIKDMRHERDTAPGAANHWSVQMGTHLSYLDADRSGTPGNDALNAPYPTDCDLSTGANCADVDYAPCISCHDPHGTGTVESGNPATNFMMRRKWITIVPPEPYLCAGCHP